MLCDSCKTNFEDCVEGRASAIYDDGDVVQCDYMVPMEKSGGTSHCLQISIVGALANADDNTLAHLIMDGDRNLSAVEVKRLFEKEIEKGHSIWSGCDNRNKNGSCAGHLSKDDDSRCKFYYKDKMECMKMTVILQENGVSGFHCSMEGNCRTCMGIVDACHFNGASGFEPTPPDDIKDWPFQAGEQVDYHSVIGGPITSVEHKITHVGIVGGKRVAWLDGRPGFVLFDNLSTAGLEV